MFSEPKDRCPFGSIAAQASREEASNQYKIDFRKTRDCQVNRGFFVEINAAPNEWQKTKGKNEYKL